MPIPIKSPGNSGAGNGGGDNFLFSNASAFTSAPALSGSSLYSGVSSTALSQASSFYAPPTQHFSFDVGGFDASHSDYWLG